MKKTIVFSAPGKIIISGEHAVVYGYQALAAAVDRRIKLTVSSKKNGFDFRFQSKVPSKLGLGSSASMAVLEAAGLSMMIGNKKLDKKAINEIAYSLEKVAHGTPSGMDNTIVVYGGLLFYQKEKGFEKLNLKKLPNFLLVNTGKPLENTERMVVGIVGKKVKDKNTRVINSLKEIGRLPDKFIKTLKQENYKELKNLITKNERLLEEIGVVGQKAKKIIKQIEKLGGAAKICGAGGVKRGSGIALAYHKDLDVVRSFCKKNNLECFEVELGGEGLRKEKKRL